MDYEGTGPKTSAGPRTELKQRKNQSPRLLLPVVQKAGPAEGAHGEPGTGGAAQVQGREWVSYKEQLFSEDPRLESMPSQHSGNRVTQAHVRFLALWDPTFLRTISHSCVSVPGTVLA